MISPRRAALLGLDAPLSPIMAAVLGLWPADDDEPEYVIFWATGGGAQQAPRQGRGRQMDLSGMEALLEAQAQERDLHETREVIMALFALEGVF